MHHGELLRAETKDHLLVYHLQRDWRQHTLNAADKAMLLFTAKLNSHPGQVGQADVDALRAEGFEHRDVLDIVLVTSLFNFMNRLADGLGIQARQPMRQSKQRHDDSIESNSGGIASYAP